jgi:hypothetical protein
MLTGGFNGKIYPSTPTSGRHWASRATLSRRPTGARRPCRTSGGQRHARGADAPRRQDGLPCGDHLASAYLRRQDPIADRAPPADCPRGTVPLCGSNCMGFYHPARASRVGTKPAARTGPIGLISHSGSLFCPRRQRSSGDLQPVRLAGTGARRDRSRLHALHAGRRGHADDRTIPGNCPRSAGLHGCLERRMPDVPVVAVKVGKTAEAARLAVSHSAPSPATTRPTRRCSRSTGFCGQGRWTS